jgi:Cdc6-like AAA superfamily ATPase
MAHFNQSWDLPPLVGSCYMYGPQHAEGYTKEQVEEILADKDAALRLKRIFDDLHILLCEDIALTSPDANEEANLLTICLRNLSAAIRARRAKIPTEFL